MKRLTNFFKCPVLIHCCMHDEALENPDKDTIALYECFYQGNEHNTFIVLSDDGAYNRPSKEYKRIHNLFRGSFVGNQEGAADLKKHNLTPDEIKKKIKV